MMTLFFNPDPVGNWSDADRCDREMFGRYFWGLIAEGIYMPCSQFEALFFGRTHTEALIDETIDAARRVSQVNRMSRLNIQLHRGIWLAISLWTASCVAQEADFNRDVRPLLAVNCFTCHGPDAEARQADLRLDTADGVAAVIHSSRPEESPFISRIETDDPDERMPPPDSGHRLSEAEKQLLRTWVSQGAKYDVHWSFKPPLHHADAANGASDPIDRFVAAQLGELGLVPSPPANRYQLIRRVTLDLIGLPPTPEQVDAFVNDPSDNAFEKVVDRLLASESFGEHWARMWLDLAPTPTPRDTKRTIRARFGVTAIG